MKDKGYFLSFIGVLALLLLLEITTLFILGPIGFFQDKNNTERLAYFLTQYISYFRIPLLVLICWMGYRSFRRMKRWQKVIIGILLLLYVGIFYMHNFQLKPNRLFLDITTADYLPVDQNQVPLDKTVLGFYNNGQAKAYPLEYIAYHHKLLDTVGGKPILPTYCIWTRTGRVFDPIVDGQLKDFELVGLKQYNAILKDKSTNSWWQQATGEALTGSHQGEQLKELFSEQMRLEAWIEKYPQTLVLQPDSSFIEEYAHNSKFVARFCEEDNGQALEPWVERSWVIGVHHESGTSAFDFLSLREHQVVQDFVGDVPVLVVLKPNDIDFGVWDRRHSGAVLDFEYVLDSSYLKETLTNSIWSTDGKCVSGSLEGEQLKPMQASEEYWYAWENFHPNTKKVGGL